MFSKQNRRSDNGLPIVQGSASSGSSDVPSIIAEGLKIVGNILSTGAIEIQGEIEGNVTCKEVTIRKTGFIKGDVVAEKIQVDGRIDGLVKGKNVTLSGGGKVTGIVMYETLAVQDGAFIDGQCKSADKMSRRGSDSYNLDSVGNGGSARVVNDLASSANKFTANKKVEETEA